MDFIMEILFELYLGFAEMLVPEHKFKKWQEVLLKLLCVLVALSILIFFGAGISLLIENKNDVAGIALTATGGAILLVQTIYFLLY